MIEYKYRNATSLADIDSWGYTGLSRSGRGRLSWIGGAAKPLGKGSKLVIILRRSYVNCSS